MEHLIYNSLTSMDFSLSVPGFFSGEDKTELSSYYWTFTPLSPLTHRIAMMRLFREHPTKNEFYFCFNRFDKWNRAFIIDIIQL